MKINEFEKGGVTQQQLDALEKVLDQVFSKVGIDIEFTRHFIDRVNDERNIKPISIKELAMLFKKEFIKYGKPIAQLGPDAQAVMKDLETDINIPFVLNWNGKELELVAKTVMRKKNFKTPNPEFPVENYAQLGKAAVKLAGKAGGKLFKGGAAKAGASKGNQKLAKKAGKIAGQAAAYAAGEYAVNKLTKKNKELQQQPVAEDFGSVPPLAELILMAVVAKTSVDVLIGMFKVALKTGKGLKKLNDLRKRVANMGQGVADYALPEATKDELLAKMNDQYKKGHMAHAIHAMRALAQSKGDRHSLGYYAATIARAFSAIDRKELEAAYREQFAEGIIHEDTLTELNILRKKDDGVKQSNPLVVLDKLADRRDNNPFPIKFYDGETIEVTPKMARRFMNKYYDDLEPEQRDIVDRYITTKNGFIQAVKKLQIAEGK
jgi:hypothetical protein